MFWERNGDTFTATAETLAENVRFHLAVERLSPRSWDWTVWQPGQQPRWPATGPPTAQVAMMAAEVAAS
jgi:hypothetical protein